MRQPVLIALAAFLALLACGCTSAPEERPLSADAFIEGRLGDDVRGLARFTETAHGLRIVVELLSAPPGLHGVHINAASDCNALSTGGHFNPERRAHGARGSDASHAGDLGNIEIADNGTGQIEFVTERLSLRDVQHSILGRTIVIDERRDDPLAQPWGDCGAPVACGVIRLHIE